jgi:hypothetical protein
MVYEDDQAYLICTIAYNFLLSKLVNIYMYVQVPIACGKKIECLGIDGGFKRSGR